MDGDKNLVSPNTNLKASNPGPNLTRAKSFKVTSGGGNYSQYVNTIKAYASAGMPFEHIANAGETLGDLVERSEIDAPLSSLEGKIGEVAEDESKLMAWQNRGEVISLTHQLPGAQPITGQEIVTSTQGLTFNNPPQDQTRNVIEGIGVFNQTPPQIQQTAQTPVQNPTTNSQLENNPYLKAPANLNKV